MRPDTPSAPALRQRAEERLAQRAEAPPLGEAEALRVLHELQVHQVELLMQNEALQEAQAQAQEALGQLSELNASIEQRVVARTAELLAAREAAEAASQAKSSFLSNMSHELRTPMNGVMGMIDLSLRAATDAHQIDWLRKARRAAAHLLSVINDVLDISKIEADRFKLEPAVFELASVMELMTDLLAPQVAEKGLQFAVDIAPELAARRLVGDRHRLGQVLLNLAGNAVKFTDQGGVQVTALVAEESATDALVRFEVKDSGIGVAPEDHARMFVAFEQADTSMSRSHGGTGLGLAISTRMVRLMGGEIGIRSALGAGSTFWFTARLGKAGPAAALAPRPAGASALAQLASGFAGTRVLLVEDNPVNQEVMRGLVEDAGLSVDVAEDGLAALAFARATDYALILMDLQMPKMGGIEAAGIIRTMPGRAQTPVIALTASVFDQDRARCLEGGMSDHIAKPVEPDILYTTLLAWLRPR
jgi:signal transduction histidine kinase